MPRARGRSTAGPTFAAFDLDGTLFDSGEMTVRAVGEVFDSFDVAPAPSDEVRGFIGHPIEELYDWFEARLGSHNRDAAIERFVEAEYAHMPGSARLFPGVEDMLVAVRDAVATVGLFTNARSRYAGAVIEQTGLAGHFDAIRPRREGDGAKARILADLIAELGAGRGVVVGDRLDDVRAAHANGVPAIGALYGFGSADELSVADARAGDPRDVPDLVATLLEDPG